MKRISALIGLVLVILVGVFFGARIVGANGGGVSSLPNTFDPSWSSQLYGKVFGGGEITWNGFNTVQIMVARAIERGMPATTVVLLLLLPLVATVVSFLHYVVGISGYGTFMPTVLAVVLLATGLTTGLFLFVVILVITVGSNWLLKPLRLHYWPQRSMSLMFVALFIFGIILVAPELKLFEINSISIFSVLMMIILVEDFVRTQLAKSKREAKRLAIGTLVLASLGSALLSLWQVQVLVLSYPELVLALVLVANWWIGRYTGMRLSEVNRFRRAIR